MATHFTNPSNKNHWRVTRYFANLSAGRFVLWCYFLYWLVIVVLYFDSRPKIWLTSLGLSAIVGYALYVNAALSGPTRQKLGAWPVFRLFLTPFCVSSFAALVKDEHFLLIVSPRLWEMALAAGLWAGLGSATAAAKRVVGRRSD